MNPLLLDSMLATLHHWVVFSLVAVLAVQLALAGGAPERERLHRLGRLDRAYGALAALALIAGFARAVYGAKGWASYADQPWFWAKLGVFALIGVLSIVPTLRLARWRRAGTLPDTAALRGTRAWMWAQAALLPLLPLFAALMARRVGA